MTTVALLSSATERLKHLLEGVKTVDGVEVEQLYSVVSEIADRLSDADEMTWRKRGRELACDMEDTVECLVRRGEVESYSSSSCAFKWMCFSSSYEESSVKDIHRRARELADGMSRMGSSAQPQRLIQQQQQQQPFISSPIESAPVGLQGYESELTDLLVSGESPELTVITICGMGGIGKTTLAMSMYRDPRVREHFDCLAWSAVSQDYQARHIMVSILSSLSSTARTEGKEIMDLAMLVYRTLYGRRYLIFLDDVWSTEAWHSLRFAFPDHKNGSRIIITTRLMTVAHDASNPSHIIEMKMLSEEATWQLFLSKSGLDDTSIPPIMHLREKIIRSCEGLPLAISVIGQILSTAPWQDWELILQEPERLSTENNAYSMLEISYRNLPSQLKPCFLYMGVFPPDQPIYVDKMVLLWKAEGLISRSKETDQAYFEELVNRSLVLVYEYEDVLASTKIISGHLHDLIRDVCIDIVTKEEFFDVIDAKKTSSSTCRIAVYLHELDGTNVDLLDMRDVKRIRSILFFDRVEPMPKSTGQIEFADLTRFQRVRVLDFDGVDFRVKRLPRGIEQLIYLRHLGFRGCYLQELPSSFANFFFLETLDLRVIDSCTMTIPNVLRKLPRLTHLYFPLAFQCVGKEKLKLDTLTALEVVENFHAGFCDAEDLLQLENLQILTGTVDGNNADLANTINSVKKMKSIRNSSIVVKRFDCYSEKRLSIVKELLESDAVFALDLEGHIEASTRVIAFGLNYTQLVFNGSEFSEDPMPILGKLPNLKSLVLCNNAFLGLKMECCASDFPQLKRLKLATLQYLEEWELESGTMPSLTKLTFEQCEKLVMLPFDKLAEISTLRDLMIGSMPESFQNAVKDELESDDISVTYYDCGSGWQ